MPTNKKKSVRCTRCGRLKDPVLMGLTPSGIVCDECRGQTTSGKRVPLKPVPSKAPPAKSSIVKIGFGPDEVPPYSAPPVTRRLTANHIRAMKGHDRITCLTAYDYPTAAIVDEAGIDLVLVGDSLGNVIMGLEDTLGVTMDHILHHTRAVARALKRAYLVADLPFLTYQLSSRQALRNAGRLVAEGGAQAVKLEGGVGQVKAVKRIIAAGIPVMGHIGLTPQSVHGLGGYRMQGKTDEDRNRILDDALALQDAGVFSLVVECVEPEFTARITEALAIPTIGIGSGPDCDGQVLVVNDMLGLTVRSVPRFVKQRADLRTTIRSAVQEYIRGVKG